MFNNKMVTNITNSKSYCFTYYFIIIFIIILLIIKLEIISSIINIIKLLSISKDDEQKWVKYYYLETYKYYDYIVNIIPNNYSILEAGCGGGVFYYKYKDILSKLNNKYTCIDIDEPSINYAKSKCDYVNFYVNDICNLDEKELKQFDMLLLVQTYVLVPNIDKVFKLYFKSKPNGCIMMINTIFPNILSSIISSVKPYFSKKNNCNYSKALTLNKIKELGNYLERKITNIYICKSLSGFDEYLTIIH